MPLQLNIYFAIQFIFISNFWVKDHFVYAMWASIKFSVSNFDNARLAYLDKYPVIYFHERVLWRLADLPSTPHILASLAARETNPVRI